VRRPRPARLLLPRELVDLARHHDPCQDAAGGSRSKGGVLSEHLGIPVAGGDRRAGDLARVRRHQVAVHPGRRRRPDLADPVLHAAEPGLSLHPAAAGFARAADVYERARPEYPPEAVAWLADRLDLRPGRVVVDVAAGTGKLTRLLVPTGARVVAVEPLAEMRAVLMRAVPEAAALEG